MLMKNKKTPVNKISVLISSAITAALLASVFFSSGTDNTSDVFSGLLIPLMRLLCFVTIGIIVGQMIEAMGWTRLVAWIVRPAFRFSNLGERCGAAFTTAFFSGTAANAMLADFYADGKICRKQLFLTCFINHLPAYFLHVPTTFLVIVSLVGTAGAVYFLLTFIAVVLRTTALFLYGHFTPDINTCKYNASQNQSQGIQSRHDRKGKRKETQSIIKKLIARIINIFIFVIPVYTAVFVLNRMGAFEIARMWLADVAVTTFIPVDSLSLIVLSFVAEFTSGFAAAGAMLESGVLTLKQAVLALLIGTIIAFPVRALRHQLPRYIGIYSPKTGIQLVLVGQGFRVVSLLLVGTVYYLF